MLSRTSEGPGAEWKKKFQESLLFSLNENEDERDQYLGEHGGLALWGAITHSPRSSITRAHL